MNLLQTKLKNIKTELESVVEIIDGLSSYNDIPNIDIELIKQKIISSYDEVIKLSCIEKQEIVEEISENSEINIEEEEDFEVKFIETVEDIPEDAKEYYEKVIEEREKESKKTEIATKIEEKAKQLEQTPERKTIIFDTSIDSPLIEIFKNFEKSDDVAAKLQFNSINDVKSAISINDRIGYISDLFNGNNEVFNTCLDNINNANDINIVIKELNDNTTWDIENPIHKSFLEIVYRKFI
jgi:hypothetical protein